MITKSQAGGNPEQPFQWQKQRQWDGAERCVSDVFEGKETVEIPDQQAGGVQAPLPDPH